ncbi:MAG: pyridoxal-dependent decarboxylase [Planctomycetota bacterium]
MSDSLDGSVEALALLREAYSAESFRQNGHRLVDMLADHLQSSLSGEQDQTIPWHEPADSREFWAEFAEQSPTPEEFTEQFVNRSVRISDPRFIGHQICQPVPNAVLASMVVETLNNGSGVYEMGMAGTGMEHHVISTVANAFGFSREAQGFMTSGGTLANLTALLAARSIRGAGQDWDEGSEQRYAVLVSEQAHYCVDRAVRIMGWGEGGIIRVPCNDAFQMRTELLPDLFASAEAESRKVIAVVGSACSTSTGSFDDLQSIAEFCDQHSLWFHVDGAHGAALAFSKKHRQRLNGLEHADSVVIDFHKMLMTPVLSSAIVFRRGEDSFRAFSVKADYLFARDAGQLDEYNLARRTFECTKSVLSARIYSTLAIHGTELLEANIDRLQALGGALADCINDHEAFELLVQPETNIVCFRYNGPVENETLEECNNRIREALKCQGAYYIVKTKLDGQTWLRCTVANPFTQVSDFEGLLARLSQLAQTSAAQVE